MVSSSSPSFCYSVTFTGVSQLVQLVMAFVCCFGCFHPKLFQLVQDFKAFLVVDFFGPVGLTGLFNFVEQDSKPSVIFIEPKHEV